MAAAPEGEGNRNTGPLDRYLRPRVKQQRPCVPLAAFRSTNMCQQLLAQELGWPAQRSLNTWLQVQASSAMLQLQLPPVWAPPPSMCEEVCCLELQPTAHSSSLAAVGYSSGTVHIVKLADMLEAVQAAGMHAAPSSSSSGVSEAAAAAAAAPPSAALHPGCVWTVDLLDRLLSCCWSPGDVPELATAGAQGVKIRRFAEGRHHEYPLKLKGGAQLAKPGQVKYLDEGAAYTLVAARQGGVVLWDCRAASQAVAEVPTSSPSNSTTLLQPMPGGTVLLAAAADGQLSLYDVRRVSNSTSSIVNFGGSRASQQLIASFNVPARADEAAASSSSAPSPAAAAARDYLPGQGSNACGSSLGVPFRIYPFFRDVQLNPADANLLAYIRPDLQVGVFDLYHNRVLQQVCVTEALGSPDASSVLVGCQRQGAARGCWDSSGRVLYTHGLLRQCQSGSGVAQLQPTLAAVDFGSWSGRHQRRGSCWRDSAGGENSSTGAGESAMQHLEPGGEGPTVGLAGAFSTGGSSKAVSQVQGGVLCKGGQVLHLPLPHHAVPTEIVVSGIHGELFIGTMQGDVLCVH